MNSKQQDRAINESALSDGENLDKVLIGTIMVLIPGLAFGNALRDMLGGNLLSGAMRILECLLLSAMIAFGYAAALTLLGGLLQ